MKTVLVDYDTLKFYFTVSNFTQPLSSEVYYKKISSGWELQFIKNNFYIKCIVKEEDLLNEKEPLAKTVAGGMLHSISNVEDEETQNPIIDMSEDQKNDLLKQKIAQFEVTYLKEAIEILKFEGE